MRLLSVFSILILVTVVSVNGGRGGGRGGGGGRSAGSFGRSGGRSSSSGSWGSRTSSSSSRSSSGFGSRSSGGGFKKKGSLKKKLLIGAAVGAGAYVAYKGAKATAKFAAWSAGNRGYGGWGYNDWNGWRQEQGMLCRTDNDCWMDSNLACERNDFDFVLNRNWFGGDWNSIIGQCECRFGQWDHTQLQCQAFGGAGGFFAGVVGILVILLMIGCFGCCCIGIACWFCRRQSA